MADNKPITRFEKIDVKELLVNGTPVTGGPSGPAITYGEAAPNNADGLPAFSLYFQYTEPAGL